MFRYLALLTLTTTAAAQSQRWVPPQPLTYGPDSEIVVSSLFPIPQLVSGFDTLGAEAPPLGAEVSGVVVVSFIIEPDGQTSEVAVFDGLDSRVDCEAVRIVSGARFAWPDYATLSERQRRLVWSLPIRFRAQ